MILSTFLQDEPADAPISVVIPTLNRHRPLERAVRSAGAQDIPAWASGFEIVVVDNSTDANAAELVSELSRSIQAPVRYVSVPTPGVATARNAGIAASTGTWLAFLDDDEEAAPGWLAALVETAQAGSYDAVFGPIRAQAETGEELGSIAPYFSRRIERPDGADITSLAAYLGTNNSLFRRSAFRSVAGPFETRLDSIGGEDSLLLQKLVMSGRRLGWASGAGIVEWVPPRRMNWAYVRRRKFLSGQIRTFVNTMTEPPRRADVLFWMAAGTVQAAGAGLLAALLYPVRRTASLKLVATMFGGLGKLLWARRLRPTLYGSGLVS